MRKRYATFCLFLFVGLIQFLSVSAIGAQSSDAAYVNAYRMLFRRAVYYERLADEAEQSGQPKPYLRHILADNFSLSQSEEADLVRLALAYQREIDPIRKEIAAVEEHRTGMIELAKRQQLEISITISYRDLLHNSISEKKFEQLDSEVRKTFAGVIR